MDPFHTTPPIHVSEHLSGEKVTGEENEINRGINTKLITYILAALPTLEQSHLL